MRMSFFEKLGQKVARTIPANPIRSKLSAPIASISFDDIPFSAARVGAPILEAANLRGTFYVCGKHTGQTFEERVQHLKDDLIALHEAGHEIACHTFAHPDVRRLSPSQRLEDIEANRSFIRETLGDCALSSFAYPYGAVSLDAKMFYARHFFTCRGVFAGLNSGLIDFSELKAVGIESRQHDMGRVRALIDEAKASNGWLIFFTHDVDPNPSAYGCKPNDLEDVIMALQDAKVETLPVKAGAARAMFG
jgi:peptidoglycan/xylan/chitin deacetylase (PgdA/CDA1 family)